MTETNLMKLTLLQCKLQQIFTHINFICFDDRLIACKYSNFDMADNTLKP